MPPLRVPYRHGPDDAARLADRELATRIGRTRVRIATGIAAAAVCSAPIVFFASCALSIVIFGAYFPKMSGLLAAAIIVAGLASAERIAVAIVRRCIPAWVTLLAAKYDADPHVLRSSATPYRGRPK